MTNRELHFYIVDLLAHEYGWSVEYIQNLTLPEINGLLKAIIDRKRTESIIRQIDVAKGFAGKISPNWGTTEERKVAEDERKNFEALKRLLNWFDKKEVTNK